jgi:hypothetical protein
LLSTSFQDLGPDAGARIDGRHEVAERAHLGRGRPILPPMPILMYRNFTDADLEAIFAYLQSIPAIRNKVPEPQPPSAP